MVRATVSALLGIGFIAAPGIGAAAEAKNPAAAMSLLRQIDEGFVAVFEKVAPAVVVIEASKKPEPEEENDDIRGFDFFLKDGDEGKKNGVKENGDRPKSYRLPQNVRSEGSGFIVRGDGYILTNHHVVADAEKLEVRLKDGRILPAKVIGTDDKTDIAVLKVTAKELPVAELGDSDKLRVGQLVCAIGAPFNQDYSFTCGWVSGKGRTNLLGPTANTILYEDYIQTDAFINPGNSGGPLFDVEGRVVGMNTLINGIGRGLAFAIPANMLADISGQLIATGRVQRPWLGIRIETLAENAELRARVTGIDKGIVVRTIEANAPAYKSDLRPADVITAVDGVKLATARDLQKEILKKRVGQTVQLTVWRGGSTIDVPVVTGELPTDFTKVANLAPRKSPEPRLGSWGMKLRDNAKGGAVVAEVAADGPAARAGVLTDDLIAEVEAKPVANAAEVLAAIDAARGKEKKGVILNIDRNGKRTFAVLGQEN